MAETFPAIAFIWRKNDTGALYKIHGPGILRGTGDLMVVFQKFSKEQTNVIDHFGYVFPLAEWHENFTEVSDERFINDRGRLSQQD